MSRTCCTRRHATCEIATAAHPLADAREFFSPDVVKVVVDVASTRADVFARADSLVARCVRERRVRVLPDALPARRHVGIYAYRARSWRVSDAAAIAIEEHEKLEQLRALAHGHRIAVLHLDPASRRESIRRTTCSACGR